MNADDIGERSKPAHTNRYSLGNKDRGEPVCGGVALVPYAGITQFRFYGIRFRDLSPFGHPDKIVTSLEFYS